MNMLWLLVPISLALGGLGLVAFFWSMSAGQYDDLAGAAERILFDEDDVPQELVTEKTDRADRRA